MEFDMKQVIEGPAEAKGKEEPEEPQRGNSAEPTFTATPLAQKRARSWLSRYGAQSRPGLPETAMLWRGVYRRPMSQQSTAGGSRWRQLLRNLGRNSSAEVENLLVIALRMKNSGMWKEKTAPRNGSWKTV